MEIGGISLRSGLYVDQLQILYRNPSTGQLAFGPTHGGGGGGPSSFALNPGEFITQVSGRAGKYVDAITFLTNEGRSFGPFGGGGGAPYRFPDQLQPNVEVFGFFGRSGLYLDAIGFHTRQRSPQQSGNLAIVGVEATQAIQYWNTPAGQGSGYAANNSMPLVSERETILRVYVNVGGGAMWPLPATVSGLVTVSGFSPALGFGGTLDLQPIGGPINGKPIANVQRMSVVDTLNFRIPAAISQGTIHCDVRVFDPAHPANVAETFMDLTFHVVPPLSVVGVLVHYTGVNFFDQPVDGQPTALDTLATLDWVSRAYPIPGIAFNGWTILPWTAKLAVTQNLLDLFYKVAALQALSASTDIYMGVMPPVAGCGGICGYGSGLSAVFFAGDGPEAAHEIGHALGREHTPCAQTAPDPDPYYPTYDAYPQGSIGEVGFDISRLSTFDPNTTFDFMSYCDPVWVSPYTYLGLMSAIRAPARDVQGGYYESASIWNAPTAEFLYLQLRLHRPPRETVVEVKNAIGVHGVPPRPIYTLSSSTVVELVDANGRLVDSYRCASPNPHQDENGTFSDVAVTVPVLSDVHTIRVLERGSVVGLLQPVEQRPRVEITEMTRVQERGVVHLRWRAEADPKADPGLQYGLRYSNDGGKTWQGLAVGLTATDFELNLALLPGGPECRVQVIASAGLRSAVAETAAFEVARKPRQAHIVFPEEGREFEYGELVSLRGGSFSPDYGMAPPADTLWTSDTQGILGSGYRLPVHGLLVGRHVITLHVPDGQGGEAVVSRAIRITEPRDHKRQTDESQRGGRN
jgi:hypothetical protein